MKGLENYLQREEIVQNSVLEYVMHNRDYSPLEVTVKQHNSGYVNFPILGGGSFTVTVEHKEGNESFFVKRDSDFPAIKTLFHKLIGRIPKLIHVEAHNLDLLEEIDIAPKLLSYIEERGLIISEYIPGTSILQEMNDGSKDITGMIEELGGKYAHLHSIGLEGRDYRIHEHMKVTPSRIVVLDWGTRLPFERRKYIGKEKAIEDLKELQIALHYEFRNSNSELFLEAFSKGYDEKAEELGVIPLNLHYDPHLSIRSNLYYNAIVRFKKSFYSLIHGGVFGES